MKSGPMTKRGLFSLLAVVALCQPAMPGESPWVKVTRPMLACDAAGDDDQSLKMQFLIFLEAMPVASPLPEQCRRTLRVGDTYLLDADQREAETKVLVKLWEASCSGGSIETKAAIYAPPRRSMGAYLTPIRAPAACGTATESSADQ